MNISLNWIKDFVDLGLLSAEDVRDRITISTAEVEGVESVGAHFTQIVTARVVEVNPHPNADKLKLVRVADGLGEMEVVCGAPNVAVGQVIALAKAGADLPSGRLQASTIRGVRSEGMICAEDELGLSDNHDGVLVLPEGTQVGLTLDKILGAPDIVLEVDNKSLTHRPDLWGHVGFAREFSAVYKRPFNWSVDQSMLKAASNPDPLRIDNRVPELCPRYSALVVRNVFVAPSPEWLQQRLRAVGLRPINNLVDVTNYVMLELGQPMHAFDRRQIAGDCIVIRQAEAGERFTTLDEQEHELIADDIIIADSERAVALGGVMGGLNSEIVPDTTCVVLESANFQPTHIRRTANRLGLRTDSAMRFEKGQDPAITRASIARAVELIRLTCPEAEVGSEFLDSWSAPPEPVLIEIDFEHIHERLGERLPEEKIIDILERLHFTVERVGVSGLRMRVPSYRATRDVSIKADIVEEIGRIFGYDNITPIPPKVLSDPPRHNELRRFEWDVRDIMAARLGFDEVSNYSFVAKKSVENCGLDPEPLLRLQNPLSHDLDRLRGSLVPHMVENVVTNQKRLEVFRFFELGKVTHKSDRASRDLAEQNLRLAGVVVEASETPYYTVKGAVESLASQLDLDGLAWIPDTDAPPWLHPGRAVRLESPDGLLGWFGELHPRVADAFEVRGRVGIFDFDADRLFGASKKEMHFKHLRRFPVNPIEITAVCDTRTPVGEVARLIEEVGGEFLVESRFLYLYEGEHLDAGKKAVTYHVVFGADDRTLGREEVAGLHERLAVRLREAGMPLRGE